MIIFDIVYFTSKVMNYSRFTYIYELIIFNDITGTHR